MLTSCSNQANGELIRSSMREVTSTAPTLKKNTILENKKWLSLQDKEYIRTIPAREIFPEKKSFSISIWFRTNKKQTDARLFSFNGREKFSSLALELKDSKVQLLYRNEVMKFKAIAYDVYYSDQKWHHMAATYSNKRYDLYYDGVLVASSKDSFLGFGHMATTFGSYLGTKNFYIGDLDEASVWSSALNADDIKELFNQGVPTELRGHIKSATLLRWWRMGDVISHPGMAIAIIKRD